MEKQNEYLINYFKRIYKENKEQIENETSHFKLMSKMYKFTDMMLEKIDVEKQPNEHFEKFYEEHEYDENQVMIKGSILKLKTTNLYVEDIKEYNLKSLYPNIFRLLYHNTEKYDYYKYYVYILENRDIIDKGLTTREKKLLKLYINYKFGWLSRFGDNTINEILSFSRNFIMSIFNNDKYNDILYIDTDSIFAQNTTQTNDFITNEFKKLFDYDITHHFSILFLDKKKLMFFKKKPFKMWGIGEFPFYKNKQRKNDAYDLYLLNHNELTYREFHRHKNTNDEYMKQAKLIYQRNEKMKTIK